MKTAKTVLKEGFKYSHLYLSIMTPMLRFLGRFVWRFPGLPHFDNSILAGLCQYDNQTFSANQSIITSNCSERCQCHHINGTAITTCKPLCPIEEDPKCHPHSERLAEFETSLNDTNCTCTKKKCVSGIKICNILFLSLSYLISVNNLMYITESLEDVKLPSKFIKGSQQEIFVSSFVSGSSSSYIKRLVKYYCQSINFQKQNIFSVNLILSSRFHLKLLSSILYLYIFSRKILLDQYF